MASIYKKGSKIYISWYDATKGKRYNKSTGLDISSANLRKAKTIAKKLQTKLDEETDKLKSLNIQKVTISYAFDHFLRNNIDKHHKTKQDYHRFYKKFIEFFNEEDACSVINKLSVEGWIIEIKQLNLQPNSIFGYYKQMNHFLNFLFEYSYTPMFKINKSIKPKPEIKEKIIMKDDDIQTIFSGLKEKNSNFVTAIYTLFFTGLRSSDILTITCDKVDLDNRVIGYYSPKRKVYRMVGFHEELVATFRARINEVGDGPLFEYNSVENLGKAVTRYFDKLDLGHKNYTARTFRKTFITKCRSVGMDATIVAELVGHEHQSTADRYYNSITTNLMKQELTKFPNPLK